MVPPHVFEVAERSLRYARFEPLAGSLENTGFEEVSLPEELFQEGPLGGPIRDREAFDRALDELLSLAATEIGGGSLLLPDRWLRTIQIDAEGAGEVSSEHEFLQWRLKKLVPFRVEDLRVRCLPEGVGRGDKLLVGFAVNQLLSELEEAFEERGIRLGLITNRSLPMAGALNRLAELRCIAVLDRGGYSLVFVESGRVVLVRYKALDPLRVDNGLETVVRRDLRITRSYLEEEFPYQPLSRSLVCGPPESDAIWTALLENGLGVPSGRLGPADLRPASSTGQPWHVMAPLLGAAGVELG